MSPAATAYAAYRSAEIETISQKDLIVRLYQGAEKFLEAGRQAMELHQLETAMVQCRRAKEIFIELMSTLNFEQGGELAKQLKDLYAFFIVQITEANLRKKPEQIAAIQPIIATLREGWQQVPDTFANLSSMPAGNDGHAFNSRS
ncbi:MAG TPA: flagellar export chaperone FliS [Planctomycetota bacterium]|jgi:flagellar protein FliS|nr:flagellar export chaperone FliS [Planctomycetota bacterium]